MSDDFSIRLEVLDRDNQCCIVCNSSERVGIHYLVDSGSPNDMVSLCPGCKESADANELTEADLREFAGL